MKFQLSQLALKYCKGTGVELGAGAHNPFGLSDCANVAPCDGINYLHPNDLLDFQNCSALQTKSGGPASHVDLVGDFRKIPVESGSLDYLVSSHVIEHEPNPIAGLIESLRVLKDDGIFFCIFPKRNAEKNCDIFRSLSTLEEITRCYYENVTVESSPLEWRGHYHVYSLQTMIKMINWANNAGVVSFLIEAVEETDSKVGNGHTIVLRKVPSHSLKKADYTELIEDAINSGDFSKALLWAKISLSCDFFQAPILYAAAILSLQIGDVNEGKNFYMQCLVCNPEVEQRRREYFELFGEAYVNPVL